MGTTNEQLEKRLRGVDGFLGVFASDELPEVPKPRPGGYSLIANYSPSTDAGTHWIAMLRLNDTTAPAYFFDSYGTAPDADDNILKVKANFAPFIAEHSSRRYQWNDEDFQAIEDPANEGTCGEWSAFAVLHGPPQRGENGFIGAWSIFQQTGLPIGGAHHLPNAAALRSLGQRLPKNEAVAAENDATVRRVIGILRARS